MEEKLQEQKIKSKALTWLENYWYHYKWHTIVIAFFLFVFIFCFAQCASTETTDEIVYFAGNYSLSQTEIEEIQKLFNVLSDEKSVGFSASSVYDEEELTAMWTYYDEEKEEYRVDLLNYQTAKATNSDHLSNFNTYVATGETCFWLVSDYVYDDTNLDLLAQPLSELLGEKPENAVDDYAIRLGDTWCYQHYAVLQALPADTLVVMTKGLVYGKTSSEETYEDYVRLFRKFVTGEDYVSQ